MHWKKKEKEDEEKDEEKEGEEKERERKERQKQDTYAGAVMIFPSFNTSII